MTCPPADPPPPARAPRVSVILPTYNRERLLPRALDSALAQTLTDLEVLVVDDGSRDGTRAMLAERYGAEPRVRVLAKANGGTASARNHGLDHARGEFVAFLDSDDAWLPGCLASQVAVLEAHPEASLSVCDARYEGGWERQAATVFADPHFKAPLGLGSMFEGAWALPSCSLFRRTALETLRFTRTYRHSEDTEFLFRFFAAGGRSVLNREVLAVYVKHDGSTGEAQKMDQVLGFAQDHLRMLDAYRHLAPDPRALARHLYVQHRLMAKHLMRQGRYTEALPHMDAWVRSRPWRLRTRLLRRRLRRLAAQQAAAPPPSPPP